MKVLAKHIIDAVEHVNQDAYDTVNVRAEYSGRAMYGDSTFGLVGEPQYLQHVEAVLAGLTATEGNLFSEVEAIHLLDVLDDLRDSRREDSMGLSTIFYYPSLEVEGELEDTDYQY